MMPYKIMGYAPFLAKLMAETNESGSLHRFAVDSKGLWGRCQQKISWGWGDQQILLHQAPSTLKPALITQPVFNALQVLSYCPRCFSHTVHLSTVSTVPV